MRQRRDDLSRRLDEIDAVIIVLLDAGCDSENIGIEDDILRREAGFLGEQAIGAGADFNLARPCVGLALFIERHNDDGRAIGFHETGMMQKRRLALLQRDRIDERLALHAFEAGLDHLPLRGIDHDRHASDIRLGGDEIEELDHRGLRVDQALIHVDVDDLRAIRHLIARDIERGGVIARRDQLAEARRSRDIGALADVDEGDFRRLDEGFKPRETHQGSNLGMARGGYFATTAAMARI